MKENSATQPGVTDQTSQERFLPMMTITMLVLNAVVFTLQLFAPALLPALDRNPLGWQRGSGGGWWRPCSLTPTRSLCPGFLY